MPTYHLMVSVTYHDTSRYTIEADTEEEAERIATARALMEAATPPVYPDGWVTTVRPYAPTEEKSG